MAYQVSHRFAPISPRKARLVLDMVRGKPLGEAMSIVQYSPKRAASFVSKLLHSAQANAQEQGEAGMQNLNVVRAWADEGPMRTKYRPRARGMATPIEKRYSHINIELDTVQTGEE